jgi:hypothetical protein
VIDLGVGLEVVTSHCRHMPLVTHVALGVGFSPPSGTHTPWHICWFIVDRWVGWADGGKGLNGTGAGNHWAVRGW